MAYDTFLATCIRVSLALSAWQLMQTSLAAQDDRALAFATAVAFLVLCLFVHAPPTGLIVRRRRSLAVVIYLIKFTVAAYWGLEANAELIKHASSSVVTAAIDSGFAELVVLLVQIHDGRVWAQVTNTLFWVLLFDFLIFLLELVREGLQTKKSPSLLEG